MIGVIAGDMIGSVYERCPIKHKNFHIPAVRNIFTIQRFSFIF
jgi:hypothetical protein